MRYLIAYAFEFIGTPYKWGGSGPEGIDCSGFVQELLMSADTDPKGDQTAQGLYDHFVKGVGPILQRMPGALAFYGKSPDRVSHVAFLIDEFRVIEAGGGGSQTLSRVDAERDQAFVRLRPIDRRKDLLSVVYPNYPEWIKYD